jgi:hypothetical protein
VVGGEPFQQQRGLTARLVRRLARSKVEDDYRLPARQAKKANRRL